MSELSGLVEFARLLLGTSLLGLSMLWLTGYWVAAAGADAESLRLNELIIDSQLAVVSDRDGREG